MIHKAPWKLGFITMITGGKLESQQARKELGAATPVLVTQTAVQTKQAALTLDRHSEPSPWELSEGYSFRFSSWHVFQIVIMLTKVTCECSINASFLMRERETERETRQEEVWRTRNFWNQIFRTRLILKIHKKQTNEVKLLRVLVKVPLLSPSSTPNKKDVSFVVIISKPISSLGVLKGLRTTSGHSPLAEYTPRLVVLLSWTYAFPMASNTDLSRQVEGKQRNGWTTLGSAQVGGTNAGPFTKALPKSGLSVSDSGQDAWDRQKTKEASIFGLNTSVTGSTVTTVNFCSDPK